LRGKELEEGARRIAANSKAMLDLMMSYGLKMSPVRKDEARHSFLVVLASTFVGSTIPIIPLILSGGNVIAGAIGTEWCGIVFHRLVWGESDCGFGLEERFADVSDWSSGRVCWFPNWTLSRRATLAIVFQTHLLTSCLSEIQENCIPGHFRSYG